MATLKLHYTDHKTDEKSSIFMTDYDISDFTKSNEDEDKDMEYICNIILLENKGLDCISILKSGGSFGEIALKQTMRRTATIICSRNSHFITITKQLYNRILSKIITILSYVLCRKV